jgi:hypothetical protein
LNLVVQDLHGQHGETLSQKKKRAPPGDYSVHLRLGTTAWEETAVPLRQFHAVEDNIGPKLL